MLKDINERNENRNYNLMQLEKLKEILPNLFDKDSKLQLTNLFEIIDEKEVRDEKYELEFLGKSYSKLLASYEPESVIKADSNNKSYNENFLFIGDNLAVLQHLQKSYYKSIKCIYLDPPYNIGTEDFTYNDTFEFSAKDLEEKLGILEDEAERIIQMISKGSSSHSAWLTFMFPRLYLSRELLASDGVIMISIDDNEFAGLKVLCDELFGEENFVGNIIWKNVTDNNPTNITIEHEYILTYAKKKNMLDKAWKTEVSDIKNLLVAKGKEIIRNNPIDKIQEVYTIWYKEHKNQLGPLDRYKYIDKDGIYTGNQSVHNPGKEGYRYDILHPVTGKPCKQPLMGYRFPESTMNDLIREKKVLFGEDENKIIELKLYAHEYKEKLSSVIELDGRLGNYDLKSILESENIIFTNPKPVKLLKQLFSFVLNDNDIVLDLFAGSGTTAQAIYELNTSDGGNRKYILAQLPENVKENSPAKKAGYDTINQITQDRINKCIARYSNDFNKKNMGYNTYYIEFPTSKTLDKLDEFDPEAMFENVDILDEFGVQTIITTWMLQDGFKLNEEIELLEFKGYPAYKISNVLYLINAGIDREIIKNIIEYMDGEGKGINKVAIFGYSIDFLSLSELKDNMKQFHSRAEIFVRY